MVKAAKQTLAKFRRKAKIDKHLERKDAIQEEDGIIASIEAMSIEEHKNKVVEDTTLKILVGSVFGKIPEEIILESLKTFFVEEA